MNTYLEHALKAESFIASQALHTEHGLAWRRIPGGAPTHSLYHGSAGVILFYLELHRVFADPNHLDIACRAGDELLAYVADKAGSFLPVSFYSGWPGYCIVLEELYQTTGNQRYRHGAVQVLQQVDRQASTLGGGIGWVEPIPFADITGITGERELVDLSVGAAGAGILYLYAHRNGLAADALVRAVDTADRLLEVAEATPDGLRWLMMVDMAFPFTAPNFAHGASGVAYFLADLYRETGDRRYLDAAISAAGYVMSREVPAGEGVLVCHTEEQQPPTTFYLGVCHGPAGTGRLMFLLHRITGEARWLTWLQANFSGLVSTGAPESRTRGLWENFGQCCGDAGIGDYALFLHAATGDAQYLRFARRIADETIRHTAPGGGWRQAEHRNRPDFLETQTGYMQGAAGIGSFLLHLGSTLDGHPVKLILPETPFGG